MLVAATVTSGCHTADVASDSGSGDNTSLTNGALGNRHDYAALLWLHQALVPLMVPLSVPVMVSLFVHCGPAVVPGSCFLSSTTALLNIALAFGFTIFVVIFVTAPFSGDFLHGWQGCQFCTRCNRLDTQVLAGGHINPAVSFAFFLAQKISLIRGICYIIVQVSPTFSV